jgi:hypothetical protein
MNFLMLKNPWMLLCNDGMTLVPFVPVLRCSRSQCVQGKRNTLRLAVANVKVERFPVGCYMRCGPPEHIDEQQ